jgi:hypothetical protein
LIGSLPLGIIVGYLAQYYQQATLFNIDSFGDMNLNLFFIILYFVVAMMLNIYLNAMTGAVLKNYGEGKLTPATGWGDLSKTLFSLSGKTFVITLITSVAIIALAAVFAITFSFLADFGVMVMVGIIILIMCAVLFAFLPSLSLSLFPAYFSGTGNRESIKIAFGMGFRNWGSVIVTLLLAGIIIYVIMVIFSIPNVIITLFHVEVGILTFLFSFIAILGNILTYPVFFVFIAFQYFSIVENEQGISLQSKVDEFENL